MLSSWIDGKCIKAKSSDYKVINPAEESILDEVSFASIENLNQAVKIAKDAQKEWAQFSPAQRGRVLNKAVEILLKRNEELAILETKNTGKPISETKAVDIITGAEVLEYYAGLAVAIEGKQIPLRTGSFVYTRREPLGVVGSIGAWNYPIQIALWKSAPALAAGNSMIFKPSELTPITTLKLAEIFKEAGLPDGVFNVILGDGNIGAAISSHPDIAKISFTGSVPTGKCVMAAAAQSSLKDTTMELGGKSPLIICKDADLDIATNIAIMANFYSSGQVCTNGTRVFVTKEMLKDFENLLAKKLQAFRIGDPLNETTNFGPLASEAQMQKTLDYINKGKEEGASLIAGGERLGDKGFFVAPTVFSNCTDDMSIVKDEIFGPVMSLLAYTSEDEAVERANASQYGLAAGVVTQNLAKAHSIIHNLEAGICWINTWGESPAVMPVGGYKQSGVGRENGIDTLFAYTRTKSIQVELEKFTSVF